MQVRAIELLEQRRGILGQVAAHHGGRVADHRLEFVGCLVGFGLLPETHQGRQQHHRPDDYCGLDILGYVRDNRQHRQQQVERVFIAVPEVPPPGQGLLVLDLVQANPVANSPGRGFAQAVRVGT